MRNLLIYHIDDDVLFLRTTKKYLGEMKRDDLKVRLESFKDSDTWLGALGEKPSPDICLIDLHLAKGDRSGVDLITSTRKQLKDAVILVFSGTDDVPAMKESLDAGADDFISKHSDQVQLRQSVYGAWLRSEIKRRGRPEQSQGNVKKFGMLVGKTMVQIADRVPDIVRSAVRSVYVHGEPGTGKEVVAEAFRASLPAGVPFLSVNCSAITPTLLQSELFGHRKGAFTGAVVDKKGLFEEASGGWIFLDEIGDIPAATQVALLRVLENNEIQKVGDQLTTKVDIRVIAATNKDIRQLVKKGLFRQDLWSRLMEKQIYLPPLRERRREIPELIDFFCAHGMDSGKYTISPAAVRILTSLDWREGNIRQLRNALRGMTEFCHADRFISPGCIPEDLRGAETIPAGESRDASRSLLITWQDEMPHYDEVCRQILLDQIKILLEKDSGLSVPEMARRLGMSKQTLYNRLRNMREKYRMDLSWLENSIPDQRRDKVS